MTPYQPPPFIRTILGLDELQRQIDEIKQTLNVHEGRLDTLTSQEAELDTALETLTTNVGNLKTAVDNLIASIPPGVDLSNEIQQVQDAFAGVQSVTDEATSATPPPPPAGGGATA